MHDCSDQISLKGFIFVVLYENMLYYSIIALTNGHQIKYLCLLSCLVFV
jgi:hypothetical protein